MAISYASNSQGSRKYKAILASLCATLVFLLLPSAVQAETAWRYWSYWTATDGTWQLAMTGAADVEAVDGSVQGWRYITAGLEIGEEFSPRSDANFEAICGDTPKSETTARVAIVVDFGDASDYSEGVSLPEIISECVVVDSGSPSTLLLPDVVDLREEAGLICGINGLPASGCGEEVEITTDEPTLISAPVENETSSNIFESPIFLVGLAIIVALGAFFGLRKRN